MTLTVTMFQCVLISWKSHGFWAWVFKHQKIFNFNKLEMKFQEESETMSCHQILYDMSCKQPVPVFMPCLFYSNIYYFVQCKRLAWEWEVRTSFYILLSVAFCVQPHIEINHKVAWHKWPTLYTHVFQIQLSGWKLLTIQISLKFCQIEINPLMVHVMTGAFDANPIT